VGERRYAKLSFSMAACHKVQVLQGFNSLPVILGGVSDKE
jgi:hypothetical protein